MNSIENLTETMKVIIRYGGILIFTLLFLYYSFSDIVQIIQSFFQENKYKRKSSLQNIAPVIALYLFGVIIVIFLTSLF